MTESFLSQASMLSTHFATICWNSIMFYMSLTTRRIRKKPPMWHALDDSGKVFVNRISFHGRYTFKNGLPLCVIM